MSYISLLGVAISTMALIVVMSLFHGMENLVDSLFKSFDPDIKVQAITGKGFNNDPGLIQQIATIPGVEKVVEVKEDNVLVTYQGRQLIVKMKGVSENYLTSCRLKPRVVAGQLQFKSGQQEAAIIGRGIKYALRIRPQSKAAQLELFYPRSLPTNALSANKAYRRKKIAPGGIFAIEREFDETYILVSLDFAHSLIGQPDRLTFLEVQVSDEDRIPKIQQQIRSLLPDGLKALNANEQHEGLIKATKIEKLLVFLVFLLIISVASINIFFILSMLVIEKRRDISIFNVLGARASTIRNIFLTEGLFISLTGALVGVVFGFTFCFLQEKFGFLSFGSETALKDAYPIEMHVEDFFLVVATVVVTTLVAAYRPAALAAKKIQRLSFS